MSTTPLYPHASGMNKHDLDAEREAIAISKINTTHVRITSHLHATHDALARPYDFNKRLKCARAVDERNDTACHQLRILRQLAVYYQALDRWASLGLTIGTPRTAARKAYAKAVA